MNRKFGNRAAVYVENGDVLALPKMTEGGLMMELYLDCLPCMLKQVLEAARLVTDDEELQETIMCQAFEEYTKKPHRYAPEVCENMHAIVKQYTGSSDPYAEVKMRDIQIALSLEGALRDTLRDASDPFVTAFSLPYHFFMRSAAYHCRFQALILIRPFLRQFRFQERQVVYSFNNPYSRTDWAFLSG